MSLSELCRIHRLEVCLRAVLLLGVLVTMAFVASCKLDPGAMCFAEGTECSETNPCSIGNCDLDTCTCSRAYACNAAAPGSGFCDSHLDCDPGFSCEYVTMVDSDCQCRPQTCAERFAEDPSSVECAENIHCNSPDTCNQMSCTCEMPMGSSCDQAYEYVGTTCMLEPSAYLDPVCGPDAACLADCAIAATCETLNNGSGPDAATYQACFNACSPTVESMCFYPSSPDPAWTCTQQCQYQGTSCVANGCGGETALFYSDANCTVPEVNPAGPLGCDDPVSGAAPDPVFDSVTCCCLRP